MTSTTSTKQIQKRIDRSETDNEIDKVVVETLMSSGDGRRWIYVRLFYSGIWLEDGKLDPQHMAWKAGLRNEGLRLQASIMRHCPALFIRMWQENLQQEVDVNRNETEESSDG